MLWNIRGTNVFILGSVHVADRPLTLSPSVMAALDAADVFGFEANLECEVDRGLTHFKPRDALSNHIPADLFADTRRAWIERDLLEGELERLRPASVVFSIAHVDRAKHGFEQALGIDHAMLARAKREKKALYFLESKNDGYAPFARAPASELELFLAKAVRDPEEGLRDTSTLVNSWANDDLDAIEQVGIRAHAAMPTCFSAAIAGRNKAWVRHLARLSLANKKAVIIVGALHMVGTDNLPEVLNRAGHECIWLGNKS